VASSVAAFDGRVRGAAKCVEKFKLKNKSEFLHSENFKLLTHNKEVKKNTITVFFTISVGSVRCVYSPRETKELATSLVIN